MAKKRTSAPKKRSTKARKAAQWHLPHLMVAAGILVALMASVPVGAFLRASVLAAQEGTQYQSSVRVEPCPMFRTPSGADITTAPCATK
ncbi:MAG: hypothetical protein NTX63_01970 [Candidatus Peregrinibacteria bacterium]|nr:hypothetical protein [Candidatus Peregrinibacteria bacterium]